MSINPSQWLIALAGLLLCKRTLDPREQGGLLVRLVLRLVLRLVRLVLLLRGGVLLLLGILLLVGEGVILLLLGLLVLLLDEVGEVGEVLASLLDLGE